MNKIDSKNIINWCNSLASKRSNLEKIWQEITKYVRPQNSNYSQGSESYKDVFDSTAIYSCDFLTSGLWGLVNSSSNSWFKIKLKNKNLEESIEVINWLKEVEDIMKNDLLDAKSGFYYKSYQFYSDIVSLGTGIFFVGENVAENKIDYLCQNVFNTYVDKVNSNQINAVFRKIYLTAKEAANIFGENRLSNEVKNSINNGNNDTFCFVNAVLPSSQVPSIKSLANNMAYSSLYIEEETLNVVSEGGYHEFPYIVSLWNDAVGSLYGESPAMIVLADVKMLNAMCKTVLVAAQKQVDPPIMAVNEASIQGFKTNPGGIIYGAIDPITGKELIKPLLNNIDFSTVFALQDQKRLSIKEAFYFSLIVAGYTNTTATEVISVNEQRMRLLGAKISRIQTEFLYPLLKREFTLLKQLNKLPDFPIKEETPEIEIEFLGNWNRYQKTLEGVGINKLTPVLEKLNQINGDINSSINWQEVLNILALGSGLPPEIFNNKN